MEDYSVDDGYAVEDYQEEQKLPIKWNKSAASQQAAKVAFATASDDPTLEKQITREYMELGKSPTEDAVTQNIVENDKNNKIEQAAYVANTEGADVATGVLQERLQESKQDVIHDTAITQMAAQDIPFTSLSEDDWDEYNKKLDNERAFTEASGNLYAQHMKFSGGTVGNIFEFLGAVLPYAQGSSVNELRNMLEDKYGEDMFAETPTAQEYGEPTAFSSYLATGDTLQTIREWFNMLDPESQYDAMKFIVENVDEASGFLGGNDFIKLDLLRSITSEARGDYLAEDVDWDQGVNNAIALLDLMFVGQVLKGGASALRARTPIGGVDQTSNLGTTIRVAPETSARLQAEVLSEFGEDVASRVGANKSDVIIENGINLDARSMPGVSSDVVEDNVSLTRLILEGGNDAAVDITLAERAIQMMEIGKRIAQVKGAALWKNASTMTQSFVTGVADTGRRFTVNAIFGKDGTKGFKLADLDAAIAQVNKAFPDAIVTPIARAYDGTVKTIGEAAQAGKASIEDAIKTLRAELTRDAGGKVPRGETKQLQGELKNARFDVKSTKAKIRALDNPKSNVRKDIKQGVENRVQEILAGGGKNMLEATARKQAKKELQEQLLKAEERVNSLTSRLGADKPSRAANADLEVLNSGKLENLSAASRKRIVELTGDRTATSTTRQAADEAGDEFFLRVTFDEEYKAGSNVFIDPDDVLVKGGKAKWLADMSTKLARHLSDSFFRAFDRSKQTEKLFNEMLKPFTNASNTVKKQVVSLLQDGAPKKGELDGIVFTADDIVARVGDDLSSKEVQAVIDGYYAVRRAADVAYNIENKALRTKLLSEDMLYVKGGDFDILAAPIGETKLAGVRTAFDPQTGQVVERAAIDDLMKQGYRVMESRETYGAGANVSQYILVGGKTVAGELPEQVLRYRKGYFPRIYDEQYFITSRPLAMVRNGERLSESQIPVKTVLAATSRKEAEQLVKRLSDENPELKFDWKHDRSLTGSQGIAAELDLHVASGRMFFSKRGTHLENADGLLANTMNPVEAITRLTANAARMHNLDPVIELMKRRYMNTFGDLTNGKYPLSADAIKAGSKQVGNERVASAISFWDSINIVERNTLNSDWWRNSMLKFGEALETRGMEKIGAFTRTTLGKRDPMSVARGATFMAMIVFNPLRQLFIQSRQFLFLAGIEPKYVMSGGVQLDGMNLMAGLAKSPRAIREASAKAMGLNPRQYEQLVEDFKATGLVAATDSHIIGRDAMLEASREITRGFFGAAAQKAVNGIKGVATGVRKVGFDAGEVFNLSATYLIARRRFIRQNPGVNPRSKEALAQIAADTRSMSFGMTNPGDFAYQRGVLSIPTQFMSVMHKGMLNGVVPSFSKYGNKTLTQSEARRVLAGQTLLYGASGWGLAEILDKTLSHFNIEVDSEFKQALLGGLYDTVANAVLTGLSGEDTDLQFAKHLAAGGGFADTTKTVIADAINGDRSLLELFVGPTTVTGSRIGEALKLTGIMIGAKLDGVELTDKQWKDTVEMYPRIMSGYNNYLKASAMMRHASWVDANRARVAVPATNVEAWFAGALGITGYKQQGFYDLLKDQKKHTQYIDEIAKTFYGRVTRMVSDYSRPDQYDTIEAMKTLIAERQVLDSFLDPNDREQVYDRVQSMIRTRMEGEGITSLILDAVLKNKWGSDAPSIIQNAQSNGIITDDVAANLMTMYKEMVEVEE